MKKGTTTDEPPKKKARIQEDANTVTEFHHLNPPSAKQSEVVDLKALDAIELQQTVRSKLLSQQLNPEKTGRLSNNEQAFNVFQIPVVIDSNLLSVKELKAELKIRGLRLTGTKEQLVRRLDVYIKSKEPSRVKSGEGASSTS